MLIINNATKKAPKTLVNLGIFNVSMNYFDAVKKYYFGTARNPRIKDLEVEIKLVV